MPYITPDDREVYTERLDELCSALEEHGYPEGHVTYVLFLIVARWFKHIPKYSSIARIRGVLVGTMTEFDRRVAARYEDQKIIENGDVELEYNLWHGVIEGGTPHPDCEVCNCNDST